MTGLFLTVLLLAGPSGLERVSSAEACGRCHRDILRAWKTSIHAAALEDPIFQDALDQAVANFGPKTRSGCLGCHAPTIQYTGDAALDKKVSWEGVTCDFCHSIKTVTLSPGGPHLSVVFDGVKTGPLKDAASGAHGVAFSPIYTSSSICAGCHEYRNANAFAVLTTYSEWESSSYAKKQSQCQGCHMGATAANVVDPKIKRVKETVNLHQMPGSHSIEQLNKAVGARLMLAREGDTLQVKVEVSNRGAGHMVPTGSPLRRLQLDLQVTGADGKAFREERVYRRTVVDAQGREVASEDQVFVRAARVTSDTRLKPEERRLESFSFPVPRRVSANVRAQLWYYYSPLAQTEQQQKVSFLQLAQFAPAGQ